MTVFLFKKKRKKAIAKSSISQSSSTRDRESRHFSLRRGRLLRHRKNEFNPDAYLDFHFISYLVTSIWSITLSWYGGLRAPMIL